MRIVIAAALSVLITGCLPFSEKKMIVVEGEGVVMVVPDTFKIKSEIYAKGNTRTEAIRNASTLLNSILEKAPALEGIAALDIESSTVSVAPIYNSECRNRASYNAEKSCPVEGQSAFIMLRVTGKPAEIGGNAVSYLSDLGATDVALEGFAISDIEASRAIAITAAIEDATAKAEHIADAASSTIGGAIRIQYGEGFRNAFGPEPDDFSVMLRIGAPQPRAERFAPEVELAVSPQPIEIREKITAAFALDGPRP